MKCYGKKFGQEERCTSCEYVTWCKDSTLLDRKCSRDIEFDAASGDSALSMAPVYPDYSDKEEEKKEYTRSDLFEVISFVVSMDAKALEVLDEKIRNPEVKFSDLARKRRVSRQAVHKHVLKKCKVIPELEVILRNRRNKMDNNKKTTFMEEVCQIRRKMSKQRSQQQKENSKSSGRLTFLMRNLDLSRMSICKEGTTLHQGWGTNAMEA